MDDLSREEEPADAKTDRTLIEELRDVRSRLTNLKLTEPGNRDPEQRRAEVARSRSRSALCKPISLSAPTTGGSVTTPSR